MAEPEYYYFSAVAGRAVERFGAGTYVGCARTVQSKKDPGFKYGFSWDVDAVVRVPAAEYARHRRAYEMAVRDGDLLTRTEADYAAQPSRDAPEPAAVDAADPGGPQEDRPKGKKKG